MDPKKPELGLAAILKQAGVGDAVASELEKWQDEHATRIVFDRWLTPGKSTAVLAAVALTGTAFNGKVVMKVCPQGAAGGREPGQHTKALEDAPEGFAEHHLVRQPVEPVSVQGGIKVMFQEIAGGSFRDVRPLSATLRGRELPDIVSVVARSILSEWNPAPTEIRRMAARDFVLDHVGTRTDENGPVSKLAEQLVYEPAEEQLPLWVTFATGGTVPNLVAWLKRLDWDELESDHVLAILGRAHGDLHADNILLPMSPTVDAKAYRLIDLSGYRSDAPLSRDITHLTLALVLRELPELTERQRVLLSEFLIDPEADLEAGLHIVGLGNLSNDIAEAGEAYAKQLSMPDDWQDQYLLSLAGNALLFATREATVGSQERSWCYQLACSSLGRFLEEHGVQAPAATAPHCSLAQAVEAAPEVSAAVDRLVDVCDRWSARRTTIAVIDSAAFSGEALQKFAELGWNLVVELNPDTDVVGGWKVATSAGGGRIHRLQLRDQEMMFGRNSTNWIAAAGVRDADPLPPTADLRRWRSRYLPFVRDSLEALNRHSGRPATVVCFGEGGSAERSLVEACIDVFEDRAKVISVSGTGEGSLAEYDAELLACGPADLLEALPKPAPAESQSRRPRVPADKTFVEVPAELLSRFEDAAVLLHSEVGVESEPGEFEVGAFYRGRPISWFELDLHLDLPRAITEDFTVQVRSALEQRDTLRVMLAHSPGAGGTTIARRVAWTLKDEFPTVVARGTQDEAVLSQLAADLSSETGSPVLLLLELLSESSQDRLYELLRASSVPVVLLITARRSSVVHGVVQTSPQRSLRVGPMKRSDRLEMARHFTDLAPDREEALLNLVAEESAHSVPFFFALTAFNEEFEGLPGYVAPFLDQVIDVDREICILLALAHRFSGVPIPSDLFTELLGVAPADDVDLRAHVDEHLLPLLTEESPGMWRLSHSLIAEEVLRQLLVPPGTTTGPEDWKAAVPGWCEALILQAGRVFQNRLPDDMKILLDRLFIVRDAREPVEFQRTGAFTELLQEMTVPGRKQVMHALVQTFPKESHYWGHYGRLLSYDSGDFRGALNAVDKAITLAPGDSSLHHMRGMVFRNEIRSVIENRTHSYEDVKIRERRILELVESARASFEKATELDDSSEYGHIALAQMCVRVIEFGFAQSKAATYTEFLVRQTSGAYRALLEQAENALDAVLEIRGSDRPSHRAEETEVELQKLYDNYQALLQGWRNLLSRADTYKPPVRRRLARAYRQRAGSWRAAQPRDVSQAVELLSANLVDNPRDFTSLREWLQAARFLPASLDRAADYVATWARTESTRDALFYDYVLACLRVLEGQDTAIDEYRSKLNRCRDRATGFANRHSTAYEWLGNGEQLGRLVSHKDLKQWNRREGEPPPTYLTRLQGRISQIRSRASGTIDFGRGIQAFTVPSRAGLVRGVHENWPVTALIAFRYDGPEAWAVELGQP
ncbi:hypothetical protein ABII15_19955 [Streptomyces sp. HUAS MG91]|uniref:Aminoglycoside phosphotransferase domain-containing protein n=1 Tax=Streptomyces tabacisoli TaxID=3156398 RepID=A0AAU8IVI0_9ACTN